MNLQSDKTWLFGYSALITAMVVFIVAVLSRLTRNLKKRGWIVFSLVTVGGAIILWLFVFVLISIGVGS